MPISQNMSLGTWLTELVKLVQAVDSVSQQDFELVDG